MVRPGFALLLLLLPACTDPAERLDLEWTEPELRMQGGVEILPDGRRAPLLDATQVEETDDEGEADDDTEPTPNPTRPRLRAVDHDEADDGCWIDTEQFGLPAIHDDGSVMAFVEYENTGAGEPWSAGSWLVFVDAETAEEVDRLSLTDEVEDVDPSVDERMCRRHTQALRRRVRAANAELRAFRPLERLDVLIVDANRWDEEDPAEVLPVRSLPAAERPVQAVYQSGWFALRVPGIRVLSRQAKLDWREYDRYEFCDTDPHIDSLWGDRDTGLGLAVADHDSGACLCYSDTRHYPITVPSTVFEEIERRPTAPYRARVEACDDEDC